MTEKIILNSVFNFEQQFYYRLNLFNMIDEVFYQIEDLINREKLYQEKVEQENLYKSKLEMERFENESRWKDQLDKDKQMQESAYKEMAYMNMNDASDEISGINLSMNFEGLREKMERIVNMGKSSEKLGRKNSSGYNDELMCASLRLMELSMKGEDFEGIREALGKTQAAIDRIGQNTPEKNGVVEKSQVIEET